MNSRFQNCLRVWYYRRAISSYRFPLIQYWSLTLLSPRCRRVDVIECVQNHESKLLVRIRVWLKWIMLRRWAVYPLKERRIRPLRSALRRIRPSRWALMWLSFHFHRWYTLWKCPYIFSNLDTDEGILYGHISVLEKKIAPLRWKVFFTFWSIHAEFRINLFLAVL